MSKTKTTSRSALQREIEACDLQIRNLEDEIRDALTKKKSLWKKLHQRSLKKNA